MAVSKEEAESYAKRSTVQENIGLKLLNMLNMTKGNTILDLGCGTGYLTKVISEKVGAEGKVVAVDPDGERLKIARERYSANNIDYIQADDQTFPEQKYNFVYCNQAIHWVPDQTAVFKRVYDNLLSGGQFAFTTVVYNSPEGDEHRFFDKLLGPGVLHSVISGSMKFVTAEEYKKMATKCGYSAIAIESETQTHEWDTVDDVIDTIYSWLQGSIDFSKLDECVVKELREECEGRDGPALRMFRTYLYVILTK